MLEAKRFRAAAEHLRERLDSEDGVRFRSAPLPPQLRRVSWDGVESVYDPERLGSAIGDLLKLPPRRSRSAT